MSTLHTFYPRMALYKVVDAAGNLLKYRFEADVLTKSDLTLNTSPEISESGSTLIYAYSVIDAPGTPAEFVGFAEDFDVPGSIQTIEIQVLQDDKKKKVRVATADADVIE